jgi:F-type H+-transporting ATPase subunit epsilon
VALEVHVVTPEQEVWSGTAQMVIARGVDGMVGVLAEHVPLLIRLAPAPLRILLEEGGPEVVVGVDGGFLHVSTGREGTRVDVMATRAAIGELPPEGDAAGAA